jgi:DNA-binding CsgD family transcriptional regulator
LHNLLPGQVFREFEFVTDRAAWDASEWIQYQREQLGCYWCMSAQVSTHNLWRDYVSVNRLESRGQHTDREKALLQALLPHIGRAAELHRTLKRVHDRYGVVLAALDALLVGLVILDDAARVVTANLTAQQVCTSTGALRMTPTGRLRADDSRTDATLQQLVTACACTARSAGTSSGGTVLIGRGRNVVLCEVMPLRGDGLDDGEQVCGAAVFLIDSALSREVSMSGIGRVFELSRSELLVAEAIADGHTTGDIADLRGTSIETVRTQIKAVLSKTGARSKLDLLRLAAKLTPPLRDR